LRIQHLKVEEPVENPLGTTTGTVEGFTAADKLTFRLEKQKGDKAFAIWCLLGDFSDVRVYVRSVWKNYKAGKTSLLVAAATTDSAFGLMRHANDDFATGNGDFAKYQDMLAFLEDQRTVPTKAEEMHRARTEESSAEDETSRDESTRMKTGRQRHFAVQNQEILLCREAGQLFECLTKVFRGGATVTEPEAMRPPSSCNTVHVSPLGAFGETLLKLAPAIQQNAHEELASYATDKQQGSRLSADEFLFALMEYSINDKWSQAPIWLVAAGQCYMEIHTILQGETSCGSETFRSYLARLQPIAKRARVLYPKNPTSDPEIERNEFFDSLDTDRWFKLYDATEGLAQIVKSQDWNFPFPLSTAVLAHFLLLYPCCLNYRVRYIMQCYGVQTLGSSMLVLSTAHLYKAGQNYGLIKSAWKDMDFVLANHVAYKIGRPGYQPIVAKPSKRTDPFEAVALFRAALGVPTVDLNKAVRPRLPNIPSLAWRSITYDSDLIRAIEETNRGVSHLKSSGTEYINIVLRTLCDAENKGKNKGRKTTKYTLVELLETYERHLEANEPVFTFNHIGFLDLCGVELRACSIVYHPGAYKTAMESSPWDFVDCMLWTVADVVNKSKHKSPEELHDALLKTKFGRTVTDLESMIECAGSKYRETPL
jgi:hypothetical protein